LDQIGRKASGPDKSGIFHNNQYGYH
jgi:hypothetical protein